MKTFTGICPSIQVLYSRPTKSVIRAMIGNRLVHNIRHACAGDMDFATQQAVSETRHVGPYDFRNAFAFDPKRFFTMELDNKVFGTVCAITYPNHHSYLGPCFIKPEHRRKGHGTPLYRTCYHSCDHDYTMGGDVRVGDSKTELMFKADGFQKFWDTSIAMLSIDKVAEILNRYTPPINVSIRPSSKVPLSSLLDYDTSVFGAPRHTFIKGWITTPGSFGLVAMNDTSIIGYAILRLVIRGGGTEISLAMAPLFADSVHIAKALIKAAADNCLANEGIPKTKLGLFHPVGDHCGEGSSELMQELDTEVVNFASRVYSKGIPPRRKVEKIYGIASPMFD